MACSCAWADVPDAQTSEVERLLKYVGQSGCSIERNGKLHPAAEAADHIRKKYAHFRDDIKSTEDFIELAASRSELSKKPYRVICGTQRPVMAKQFLLDELKRVRDSR